MTTNTQPQDNINPETTTSTKKWRYIPLTQGKRAKVSIEDYDYLSQFKWYYKKCYNNPKFGYAARNITLEGHYIHKNGKKKRKQKLELMHRVVLNIHNKPANGIWVDHKNFDTLDNRRENLRVTTPAGNAANNRPTKKNTSGYRGIWHNKCGTWTAVVRINKDYVRVGTFATLIKAIRERNKVKKMLMEKHKDALTVPV